MSSLRFTIITVIIILGLAGLAYAAILGMKAPVQYTNDNLDTVGDLRSYDDNATEPVDEEPATTPAGTGEDITTTPGVTTTPDTTSTTPAQSDLAKRLQTIKDSKVILKSGAKGPQVGALQEFLNLYNKTKLKVDNDFGPTLEKNIKAFQAANKLPSTGQVAEKTLTVMIDWLAKNPQ